MDRGIVDWFKRNNLLVLDVLLVLCVILYCFMAALPKHGDFWVLNEKAKAFSLYGYDFTGITQIYYPSAFYIVQGIWIFLGSNIFGYDLHLWTDNFNLVPNFFQVWCMIPYLLCLFFFTIFSYVFLKNKWLALLSFGTLSFISVAVMGQLEIFCIVFLFLSMILFLKTFNSDRYELYAFLSIILLGLSVQYVPFAALLLPIYLILIAILLKKKNYQPLKIAGFAAFSVLLFILSFIVLWLIHPASLLQISSNGEPGWLLNLQLGPVNLPPFHVISLWLLGYILILYDAFYNMTKYPEKMLRDNRYFLFYSMAIFAWFFIAVFTHPQWWLILLPPMLLVLDNFKSRLNYLFALGVMALYIFLPMMWTNNIDNVLQYYIPTFDITVNYAIVLATLIVAVLAVWVISLRRELQDLEPSGNIAPDKRPMMDMLSPLLVLLLPFIICFIVGLAAVAVIGCVNNENSYLPTSAPIGEIYGDVIVGQTFTSDYNDLSSVDVLMSNYDRVNTNEVLFHLKASPTSEDIATVRVNAKDITDNTYHKFKFPMIPDSKGKKYFFSIESPRSQPGNAVTVIYNSDYNYSGGSAYNTDHAINGDLVFRSSYKPAIPDILSSIGGKYPIVSIGS